LEKKIHSPKRARGLEGEEKKVDLVGKGPLGSFFQVVFDKKKSPILKELPLGSSSLAGLEESSQESPLPIRKSLVYSL